MPWLMLLPILIMEDFVSYGQMLLTMLYHLADEGNNICQMIYHGQ